MKYILTSLLVIMMCATLLAQRQDRKKIESLRIAYLTEELDLSATEAQNFWPVFNEFEKKRNELRKSRNDLMIAPNIGAAEKLSDIIEIEQEEYVQLKEYISRMQEVLSDDKIIVLLAFEKKFRERLIKRLNNKRNDR